MERNVADKLPVVPIVVRDGAAPLWVELDPNDPARDQSDWVFVSAERDDEKDVPKTMDEAIERVKPLVDLIFEKLSKVSVPPKEIELNLGLKLSGRVGIFVAESSGEAAFNLKLKWTT
jgi:hypothetical protein